MAKVNIQTIANLDNPPTVVAQVNYNFAAIRDIIETLLSRDGKLPNSMLSNFDMNNNRILNLPVPISPTEPARHGDIQQYVDLAQQWALYSQNQADRAEGEADDAEASADAAQASLEDFRSRYLGAYASAPSLDPFGVPVTFGALYFDTTRNQLGVFTRTNVVSQTDRVVVGADVVVVYEWIYIPVATLSGLADVNVFGRVANDYLYWNGFTHQYRPLAADLVAYTSFLFNGSTVADALDELSTRTSLGVYDVSFFMQALMENDEELFRMIATRPFTLPVSATGSLANCRQRPNLTTVVSLYKNTELIGTVTFSPGSNAGVFSVPGTTEFLAGDILRLHGPALADGALRDVSVTLACRR